MQAACRLHFDGMQEVAGCSNLHAGGCRLQQHACSLHAGCMQPALRFKCSRLAASIEIHVHIPGVDAVCRASTPCTSGSTPCTSRSTKSCADCRTLCEYDRMQEVAGCSRLHAGGCSLHAGFMQASCSLHTIVRRRLQVAASCMQDVAGCMKAACRLHAACMQAACISSVALALLNIEVYLIADDEFFYYFLLFYLFENSP